MPAATVTELLLVLVSGVGLGLAGNALNPDGLDIGRDYFPRAVTAPPGAEPPPADPPPAAIGAVPEAPQATEPDPTLAAAAERLREKGLTPIDFAAVEEIWRDPLYAYEAYVFIDARNEDDYADGHIPGAWQFDHFHPERTQDQILPLLPTAMKIVVYCTGGDCEDSESASLFLLGMGADPTRLAVYTGGITEWRARGMDVERGARGSGDLLAPPAGTTDGL